MENQHLVNQSKSSDVFCLKSSGEGSEEEELKSGALGSTNFTPMFLGSFGYPLTSSSLTTTANGTPKRIVTNFNSHALR